MGIIQAWLEDHEAVDRVCAVQLWKEALNREFERYTRKDINAIHEIMKNNITGWKASGKQRCGAYGVQRTYDRVLPKSIESDWDDVPEDLPFDD